jgi:hypothetical protein
MSPRAKAEAASALTMQRSKSPLLKLNKGGLAGAAAPVEKQKAMVIDKRYSAVEFPLVGGMHPDDLVVKASKAEYRLPRTYFNYAPGGTVIKYLFAHDENANFGDRWDAVAKRVRSEIKARASDGVPPGTETASAEELAASTILKIATEWNTDSAVTGCKIRASAVSAIIPTTDQRAIGIVVEALSAASASFRVFEFGNARAVPFGFASPEEPKGQAAADGQADRDSGLRGDSPGQGEQATEGAEPYPPGQLPPLRRGAEA